MPHITVFNKEAGIVETRFEQVVTFDEVAAVIAESARLSKKHGSHLWLMDYRQAYYVVTPSETYDLSILVSRAAAWLEIAPFELRRALVVRKPNAFFVFARTVADSRAQRLELFPDLESAREWLTE